MPIKKILIANRGEIALRVIRTCQEMGIKTVALYPNAREKNNFLETEIADESYSLEEEGILGYLDKKRIIQIAKKAEADAIHPGYGFLAENGDFAQLCQNNGLKFIGPSPETLRQLSNKIEAKKVAKKIGCPLLPASQRPLKDARECLKMAQKIQPPFVLKALDGGGGRGIYLIESIDKKELAETFEKIKRESKSAFGTEGVFIEKFLQHPRHIEFQILGDGKGKVVHFFERECSIQRRNQKLIEEAPSVFLDKRLRSKMADKAVRLGKYLKYEGLATVEFLVDQNKRFYFLEVNPRIQVEHPVTELITNTDLVAWQIRIAQGEKLALKQKDIRRNGWAVEFRINAEDPIGFTPCFGKIVNYCLPEGKGIEVHSAYNKGKQVLSYFDSLILKLVVWTENREKGIKRARRALKELKIEGLKTLIPLYAVILENQDFIEGKTQTSFLRENKDIFDKIPKNNGQEEIEEDIKEKDIALLAASIYQQAKEQREPNRINKWQLAQRLSLIDYEAEIER